MEETHNLHVSKKEGKKKEEKKTPWGYKPTSFLASTPITKERNVKKRVVLSGVAAS